MEFSMIQIDMIPIVGITSNGFVRIRHRKIQCKFARSQTRDDISGKLYSAQRKRGKIIAVTMSSIYLFIKITEFYTTNRSFTAMEFSLIRMRLAHDNINIMDA